MDDPAFTAGHRSKEKRLQALLHTLSGGLRREPQFLNAQQAIIIRVKDDQRMILMGQPKHLHGQMFQGEQ